LVFLISLPFNGSLHGRKSDKLLIRAAVAEPLETFPFVPPTEISPHQSFKALFHLVGRHPAQERLADRGVSPEPSSQNDVKRF
jgi:hypothetical protein